MKKSNKLSFIQNFIKCFLCQNHVYLPKTCSTCRTLFCNNCIDKYLMSNQFCPYLGCRGKAFTRIQIAKIIPKLSNLTNI